VRIGVWRCGRVLAPFTGAGHAGPRRFTDTRSGDGHGTTVSDDVEWPAIVVEAFRHHTRCGRRNPTVWSHGSSGLESMVLNCSAFSSNARIFSFFAGTRFATCVRAAKRVWLEHISCYAKRANGCSCDVFQSKAQEGRIGRGVCVYVRVCNWGSAGRCRRPLRRAHPRAGPLCWPGLPFPVCTRWSSARAHMPLCLFSLVPRCRAKAKKKPL
jgi:hypothetical protein